MLIWLRISLSLMQFNMSSSPFPLLLYNLRYYIMRIMAKWFSPKIERNNLGTTCKPNETCFTGRLVDRDVFKMLGRRYTIKHVSIYGNVKVN